MNTASVSPILVLAVSSLLGVPSQAWARDWVDRTGRYRVEAELVTVRDEKVYLEKTDGQISKVPLKQLSENDLRFLASKSQYESLVEPYLPKQVSTPSTAAPAKTKMATIRVDSPSASGSIRQFRSDSWGYKGLTFSNDGAFLFTLGNDNVTVIDIDASTKTEYKIGSGNRSFVTCSPDGKRLIAGTFSGNVLVWTIDDKGNLKPENEFSIHLGEVKCIAVSPDNQHALSLHSTGVACYWDIDTGDVLAQYNDFRFLSGGDALFSQRGGQAMVTDGRVGAVIDLSKQSILQQMALPSGSGQFAAIAPDGGVVAVGRTYDVQLIDTQRSSKPIVGEGNELAWSAVFSPDGKRLISGGRENVKLWNVKTGMPLQKFQMGDGGYVKHVAFSPDGIHFAAIGGPIGKLVEVFRLPDSASQR